MRLAPRQTAPVCKQILADWRLQESQSGLWPDGSPSAQKPEQYRSVTSFPLRRNSPAPARAKSHFARSGTGMKERQTQTLLAPGIRCEAGRLPCFRPPATRAVIYNTSPGTGTRCAGPPVLGPRRLNRKRPPAAGATHSGLRRPGVLSITAPCVLSPVAPVTNHCLRPAAKSPAPPPATQCSRQALLASFTPVYPP